MKDYSTNGITNRQLSEMTGFALPTIYKATSQFTPVASATKRNSKFSIHDCRDFTRRVFAQKNVPMKKVQVFYNFKGGVGKTTLCFQVASQVALMGYKVLVIDSDPQANLTVAFGIDSNFERPTLYDILLKGIPLEATKLNVYEGLDLIPSDLSLTRLEPELNNLPKREEQIKKFTDKWRNDYDFIFIDSNPNISLTNRNAVTAADMLNIICETQPFSVKGVGLLLEDLKKFFSQMLVEVPEIHVIPNKYEDRVATSAEAMTILRDSYGQYLKPDFAIRKSEDFNQSAKSALPLAFFAKSNSIAWADIVEITHEILKKSTSEMKDIKVA